MLLKVLGVGLSTIIINLILRQYRPEFSLLTNVCGGLIIFLLVVGGVKDMIASLVEVQSLTGIKAQIVSPILKVIGVGYITEWTSDMAEESGNKSIAGKIVFGGKVAICLIALPIMKELLSVIIALI